MNLFKDLDPHQTIGLIFDVDELLFNNRNEIHLAYQSLLENRLIEPEFGEIYPGKDLFETIQNIKQKYGLKESLEELVRERRAVYIELLSKSTSRPCAGVKELFEFIEGNRACLNIRVAYATSSEKAFTEIILKKIFIDIGLSKYIVKPDALFFQNNGETASTCWKEGLMKKPDPMLHQLTVAKMMLNPHQCIAFEDSESGFQAAYKAGLNVVLIPSQRSHKHFTHFEFDKIYEGRICKFPSLKHFVPFLEQLIEKNICKNGRNNE